MPTVTFSAVYTCRQEREMELTDQEWEELQSGKKKYWDFLDSSDEDSGEWVEGSAFNIETGDFI